MSHGQIYLCVKLKSLAVIFTLKLCQHISVRVSHLKFLSQGFETVSR